MRGVVIAIASRIAMDLLRAMTQAVWDSFWSVVYDGVEQAEREWNETGKGEIRKEIVLRKVLAWLDKNQRINPVQKWAIRRFLGVVIDRIVDSLNAELGQGWGEKVTDLKSYLASKTNGFIR